MKPITGLCIIAVTWTSPAVGQAPDSLAISAEELGARLHFFSSDLFEGRYPGTRGEALTTGYLASELQSFGLTPQLQPVSIVVQRPDTLAPVEARVSGRLSRSLEPGREIEFLNYGASPVVRSGGDLVFVGYGIHAPRYRWNDFAGTDLHGKVAVILLGEPQPAGDTLRFNGVRASRFSGFSDKLAELAQRGAVGALWLLPDGSLKGPVRTSRLLSSDLRDPHLRFNGLLTDSALARLLPPRKSLTAILAASDQPGFHALPLNVRLDVGFRTRPDTVTSHNVIGVVPGSDPALAPEHVVLSAHWDAFGIGKPVEGDSIYNGALDDGSGMTALLALARVFAHHPQRRSVTFLFTTAEEWGLLGAYAFVCAGPVPPERIVANLNLDDGLELLGVKRDAAPLGVELSTLGRTIGQVAARSGLRVSPDPYPEEGFFLRADNYPFARAGVPALYMALGTDAVGAAPGYVDSKVKEYLTKHYHQPSDEYQTVVLDLNGSRQFAEFVRDVTIAVANDQTRPTWLPGAEFERPKTRASSGRCER